jgi:hypothetical protein
MRASQRNRGAKFRHQRGPNYSGEITQRALKREGTLAPERIARLDALAFVWQVAERRS